MDWEEFNKRRTNYLRKVGRIEPIREGVLTELGQGAALGAVSGLRGFASTLEELGGPAGPRKYFDAVLATNQQWNPDPDYTALSLNPANIARAVGTGAGQTATLLPAIAAGSAVGGPGGAALVGTTVFAQTYGDNLKDYRERFKDRYSENEIRAMSFGRTLVDSAIETGLGSVPLAGKSIRTLINGRAADAVARNAIKEASKKFGKETVVKALNNGFTRAVGKGALGEGGEEALQYIQDVIWRSVAGDPSAVLNLGELAENAAAGAWAGAAFGAVDAGTGRMAQRDRRAAMPPIDVAEAVSPAWMKHYNVKDDSGAELAGLAANAPEGMSPADFTIVQPKSRAAKAVDAIGRELGLDIRYFVPMTENGAALNGVFARDSDAIYLDAAGTSRNPMQSLGHEFAHYLRKQAPDLADVWDQALNSVASPEARAAEETALRETYGELGEAGAEFSADRMGDMFTDPGMWSRAVQLAEAKQAGFGAKLLKVIDRFISAVKRQLVKFKSSEVEKFITDMDAAREAAAGVVAEFKRRQAGMLVPVEEHGQARTSTEAGTLPPFEAFRELRRQQAEEAGRMAGMLVPAGTQETTTEDAPVISPAPKIPAYTAERQAERASLEKFQKDGARIDKMLTAFEKYDERTGALADSQFVERNGRLLAEVEDAIRKNNPGLVQEKLNILAKRVRNWASKRRKPEAVSEPGGKVPPPDMRANALRGRAEEREREAKPNDLPEVSTDRADNIYLRMPLERVRQDAAHGVKLAQEALKELETRETAVKPEQNQTNTETRGSLKENKRQSTVDTTSSVIPQSAERRFTITTPNGEMSVQGVYRVMDLNDLIASDHPEFDQRLQPRNRNTAGSLAQIERMSNSLNPALLLESPTSDSGSPIIDARNQVLSGNGRTLAIRRAASSGRADNYFETVRKWTQDHGLEVPDGVEQPVLVRQLQSGYDAEAFAEYSNRDNKLQRTAAEQAEADAKTILKHNTLELFVPNDDGDINTAANQRFMQAFARQVNDSSLLNSDGKASPLAEPRIRRAILAAIFEEVPNSRDSVTTLIEKSAELGLRRQLDGIMGAGANIIKIARQKPEYDLRPYLAETISSLIDFKTQLLHKKINSFEVYLKQDNLFGDTRSAEADDLLRFLAKAKSIRAVREYLNRFCTLAEREDVSTADMFGTEPATIKDILERIAEENEDQTGDLFDTSASASTANVREASVSEPSDKLREYQSMPEEWRVVEGATTAPRGFVVISNGKSRFAPGRESGLLREDRVPVSERPGKSAAAKESAPKNRSGVIEDFGEKIEGARKDYAQKLSDASRNDPAAVPLSQAFPEPDYDRLAESGIPAGAVAAIHALRDSIGVKPRNGWRMAQYTKQLQTIREMVRQIVNRELDSKQLDKVLANPLFNRIRESAELYEKLGHSKSLKGYRLSLGNYSVFGGVEYKPPKLIWTVSDSTGGRYRDVAFGDTREEAVENFRKYLDRETGEDRTRIKFGIFLYRPGAGAGKAGKVFIGKKVGSNTIELKRFDTAAEAREYLGSHQQELEELLKLKQYVPATRSDVNRGRIGQDYRGGKDVTPEMFQEKFGFRGVQFGNWVGKTEERQQNLNEAYDALHDLAGLLNVSTQALSLNGELGLAFGARGKGGVDPASAHYEPGQVVINLTRRNGAGSLAHEWFHALDNYFSRKGGVPTGYLSSGKRGDFAGVRPEMVQAFRKVIAELHDKTGIFDRSERLDEIRSKPYWSTDIEVAARAFESYLHDRIETAGGSSDYLVNLVGESAFTTDMLKAIGGKTDLQDVYPYPTQKESAAVKKIFDEFVGTLREKSENNRAVLYSLSRKPESIQDFREMPAHPRPERAKFDNLRELYDIYKREYLGKTFTAASGHTMTFKPGHFFRLIAGTPQDGPKGMVAKAKNAAEAIRMIERGEISFEDVAGYEVPRGYNIKLFKDILQEPDFWYTERDGIIFGKKYKGLNKADGFLAATIKIDKNGNIGPLSFHPRKFSDALLGNKELNWNIVENSASAKSAIGETAETQSDRINSNITDSGEKSSDGAEYSLAQKPRQQVNPIVSNENIRREYAEELGRNAYTPETVAEWDQKAVDWITRQGGVAGAVEAILNDTEHNDRHVASLVRRHVMNSDVFAKLDEDSRAKLETHHAFTGTEWGREGVARRLAALTLDSVAKVRALFDKLHADLPDKQKTELRNKVLDETGVDIFKLPKDIAENRRKLDAVLRSELAARSSRGDQLYEFWINSILSGPATHVRNVVGNTLNTAYELGPKRAVEAAINVAVRNPKGATFGEMREMWKHLDWKTAWDRAVEAFDLEVLNPSGKYNDHAGVAIGGRKGRIIRIPGRLLRAADEFCKGLIAPVEAAAYAYREGRAQKLSGQELADFITARINDDGSKAAQWGELRARELAFQEEPGAAVRWLVSLKNSNSPAGKIARFIFPFVQAPGNLLRQGVRKSPLGVASLLAVDLPRAIRSREVTPEMMARAAEQLIAWSTLAALWSAQDDDDDERPLLTGSGAPYGSNERNFKANKFPPLSVRIGDRYYTYKFFEPLSSGLAVIANGLEAMRAKRPAEAKKALVGMSGFIAEKSYLASVKELFEFFQDPEHSGTRFATNFAASWIPNAYRQAVNAFDDKVRDNRTRARGLKYFTDQFDIVTNSAGFTRALPKLDYFGREVDKDAYADSPAGPLMRLLSVQSAAPDRSMDQADRLLWNYNRRNPETAYWPGLPSYYLKQGNRTLYIEGEDYAAFARDAGQLAHKAILSEIRSGSLNVKNPGEEDIKRIKTLFAKARQTAKEKYKGKFHE